VNDSKVCHNNIGCDVRFVNKKSIYSGSGFFFSGYIDATQTAPQDIQLGVWAVMEHKTGLSNNAQTSLHT
jgi:hypothetical protein